MNQEAIKYVQNRLTNAHHVLEEYIYGENHTPLRKRNIFIKIEKYVNDFLGENETERWVIVPGLRGVGKTTILAQMYDKLLKQGVEPERLLYFSLDDAVKRLGLSLNDVLEAYEHILRGGFETQKKKTFIFIDEVQSDKNWGSVLKTYIYDKSKNIFLLTTGSSAVSLQTNADVTRRSVFEKLYPMNFWEYVMVKQNELPVTGLKKKLDDAIFYSQSAQETYQLLKPHETNIAQYWGKRAAGEIDEYIDVGTLPFALKKDKYKVYENVRMILDRIVDEDIRELGRLKTETLQSAKRLLFLLADANDYIAISKLANLIGTNHVTLASVLNIFEKAELLIKVPPHGSHTKKTTKPSKYLFMSPTYRMALLSIAGNENTYLTRRGKLIEDVVAGYFYRELVSKNRGSISYDATQHGADFILEIADKQKIVVEVGRGEKDTKQVRSTMKKINSNFGIIITQKNDTLSLIDENILCLPLSTFLLT